MVTLKPVEEFARVIGRRSDDEESVGDKVSGDEHGGLAAQNANANAVLDNFIPCESLVGAESLVLEGVEGAIQYRQEFGALSVFDGEREIRQPCAVTPETEQRGFGAEIVEELRADLDVLGVISFFEADGAGRGEVIEKILMESVEIYRADNVKRGRGGRESEGVLRDERRGRQGFVVVGDGDVFDVGPGKGEAVAKGIEMAEPGEDGREILEERGGAFGVDKGDEVALPGGLPEEIPVMLGAGKSGEIGRFFTGVARDDVAEEFFVEGEDDKRTEERVANG